MSNLDRWKTAAERVSHRKAQAKFEKSPLELKKRENRNKARYDLEAKGIAHKGDGKDVEHKNGNALDNTAANWHLGSRHKNRSYARTKDAHKVNPRS